MKKLIIVSSLALLIGAAMPQNVYSAAAAGAGASTVSDDISEVRPLLFDLYRYRNSEPTDSIIEFRLDLIDKIEARLKAKGASINALGALLKG